MDVGGVLAAYLPVVRMCTAQSRETQLCLSRLCVMLTPHPLLVPWSRKSRAIRLLPLWAVRPVQGCTFLATKTMGKNNNILCLNVHDSWSTDFLHQASSSEKKWQQHSDRQTLTEPSGVIWVKFTIPMPASVRSNLITSNKSSYSSHLSSLSCIPVTKHWSDQKKFLLFPDKIQGDSYDFDIAESEYDNQIALSPTNV